MDLTFTQEMYACDLCVFFWKGQSCCAWCTAWHWAKISLPMRAGQTADTAEASEQEEEEEEGRAGAIQKQKRPFQQDLMLYQKKGKKKRKKNAP